MPYTYDYKAYRKRNKKAITTQKSKSKRRSKEMVNRIKESNPCTDCGEHYRYYIMQFDHIGDDKVANVSQMLRDRYSMDTIMKEIQKCELVCANCHAKRTHMRAKRKKK